MISTREPDRSNFAGVSLIAEGDVDENGGLEIGLSYLPQEYTLIEKGLVHREMVKRIYMTMGYRHWFNPLYSVGLSFFSAYSMGEPKIVHTDFATQRPASSAEDIAEYGFEFSVQREAFQVGRLSAIFDMKYSLSLTSKKGEDSNFYGFLIGFKYLIQDKTKGIAPP